MALSETGSNLFQKFSDRKFHCKYRTTPKKTWVAMVATKQSTEEQFGNSREAKIEVIQANKSIEFSFISDSWVNRMIIRFYEIQETATLGDVKILLKGVKDQIEIMFGSPSSTAMFVDAITLTSGDSDSGTSQSESIGELE